MNFFQFDLRYPHNKPTAVIYAVSGIFQSYRDEVIQKIRSRHRPSDIDYFRGSAKSEAEAINILSQSPIGSHRFVELEDFESWGNRSVLTSYLTSRKHTRTIILFISSKKPKTDNDLAQFIIKTGWWVVCNRPEPSSLTTYLMEKYHLPEDIATLCVYYAGSDIARTKSLLLKLSHLTSRVPTLSEVREAAIGLESSIFTVADSLLEGDKVKALENLPLDPLPLLTILRQRMTSIIALRPYIGKRADPRELADRSNTPIFRLRQAMDTAQRYTYEDAVRILNLIAQTEREVSLQHFNVTASIKKLILTF